jgi:hypothetical protein
MRDLRDELRQRLREIEIKRAALKEQLSYLDESESNLKQVLIYEEMRVRAEEHNLVLPFLSSPGDQPIEPGGSKLTLFLRDKLSNGQTWSLSDLKELAQSSGIDFAGKQPGRVLHFALLGMEQNGAVEMVEKGVWRMRNEREVNHQ